MQFWHRVRSRRIYQKVRTWSTTTEPSFLAFAGYKVGMTHLIARENNPNSLSKGEDIFYPATIIECPALKISSLKFYKKTIDGLAVATEILLKSDKELSRKIVLPKKFDEAKLAELEKNLSEFVDVRAIVYTQPKLTGIGKKKPELFEMGIGGKSVKEKLDYVKQFIGKEIKLTDVIKPGMQLDIKGISRGKGFQGTVKRYGVAIRQAKSEKTKRGIGTLGPWHPNHVLYTVPQAGKMGFHARTEHNKQVLKVSDKPEEINNKAGFRHYGILRNPYILVKGNVVGPAKRIIRFTPAIRPSKQIPKEAPMISYISQESKQGN
jgi:large subunit ribosomal protein L3